jgi:uncharacterized membrane protein (UPF0182 family)
MSRRGRVTVGVLVGVFLFSRCSVGASTRIRTTSGFHEVDFVNVFSGVLLTRLVLFLVIGAAVALVIARTCTSRTGCARCCGRTPPNRPRSSATGWSSSPRLGTWITVVSVVIGFFAGLSAQSRWKDWMLFQNAQPFGVKDPQFKVDVGFYIFDYPLWRYLLGVGFTAWCCRSSARWPCTTSSAACAAGRRRPDDRAARAHLTTLVASSCCSRPSRTS